jgi:hypothetical protein
MSQRSIPTKTKPRSNGLETRKTPARNSNNGGDKDPTKKNLEKSHVVHTFSKRKREIQKTSLEIPEIQESPLVMDVDEIIKEPSWSEKQPLETQQTVEAMVTQEPKIFK